MAGGIQRAMPETDWSLLAWRLAASLSSSRTESEAAGAAARAAAHLTGADSCRVWLIDHMHGFRFAGSWPDIVAKPKAPPPDVPKTIAFGTTTAASAKRPFRSRLVVALLRGPRPFGAIELLERERPAGPFAAGDGDALEPLLGAADAALLAARQAAQREEQQAGTLVRLARLFDLGRSLTSTDTGAEDLHTLLVNRIQTSLEVQGAYLWLLDESKERLTLVAAAGITSEVTPGWELGTGEGVAGAVAATGEPALIIDPDEVPGLEERPDHQAGLEIYAVAAAPLVGGEEEGVIGVLEVVNREGEDPELEEDHLAFLQEAARTAAVALGNARRLEAERRAGDLGTLLTVVQALSASLDTGKIAYTLVHQSASIMSYQRAAVGLFRNARLEIFGVSGQTVIDETLPEMRELQSMLAWAAGLDEGLYVVQEEDGTIDTPRPETREKCRAYFELTGSRSFLAVPLRDDEGRLGVFAMEGAEPYAFSEREIEVAALLGTHATAAIRNATLYQQIPLARVFRPWASRKQRLMSLSWAKRLAWSGGVLVAAALLFLVPVPLRVAGEARVLPELRRPVIAEVEGRVAQVLVREGDAVDPGQVVAILDDADYRAGEEEARARHAVALREQIRMRAGGETAGAAVVAARLEGLRADVDLWQTRLERTRIRSATAGTIATPRVEEMVGVRLERGDVFCDVVDLERQRVEIALPEQDASLVGEGMPVKVKLRAFPTESFRADVERIGVAATLVDGDRVFLVQARLDDAPEEIRSGLSGQAKITTGPASIARVALRRPARWIWGLIWGWLP